MKKKVSKLFKKFLQSQKFLRIFDLAKISPNIEYILN